MIIIIGLVILIAAVVVGVSGVLSNSGSGHPLTHHFAVFGYHVTGSTGTLFLYGIVVGALAMLGLSLLLAGARRTSRRGRQARRGLTQSRRETAAVAQDRDDLLSQRDTARTYTAHDEQQNYSASTRGNGAAGGNRDPGGDPAGGRRGKWHLFGPRSGSPQAAAPPVPAVNGPAHNVPATDAPASDVPADASAAAD
jgi:uncharacterized membrane protein YciS (DUF1049 family)